MKKLIQNLKPEGVYLPIELNGVSLPRLQGTVNHVVFIGFIWKKCKRKCGRAPMLSKSETTAGSDHCMRQVRPQGLEWKQIFDIE